ncbi:MAG: hypothetical protein DHS80DRAFT_32756 [Piptocephalis tieghemiana]|nr:MAG: hypothetical protein DHS80DRAFT_32756 [Piptocephalis tieghemiana]
MSAVQPKNILIFGGVHPLGKNIALAALQRGTYPRIRVIDTQSPDTAFLQEWERRAFRQIEVMQMNLGYQEDTDEALSKAFHLPDNQRWDIVVCAYCDFRLHGKRSEHVDFFVRRAWQISMASQAYQAGVLIYIMQMGVVKWHSKMPPLKEDVSPMAWSGSQRSVAAVEAEKTVRSIKDLPLVVLRTAQVYGDGVLGPVEYAMMSVQANCDEDARIYYDIYDPDMKNNTVHTEDVARAVLHAGDWYLDHGLQGTRIFNIVDQGNFGYSDYFSIICDILQMNVHRVPRFTRWFTFFAMRFQWVSRRVLKEGSQRWIGFLHSHGITSTPLEYAADHELFATPWGIALDGSAFCQETGFSYHFPIMNEATIRDNFRYFKDLGAWPDEDNDALPVTER